MTLRAEPRSTETIPANRAQSDVQTDLVTRPRDIALGFLAKIGLMLLSVLLLSLSFAPFKQFYLAWIAFVPMLLIWSDARSAKRAMLWGWCAGVLFFFANLSYLLLNTIPGGIALAAYLGLFWAMAAMIIRSSEMLNRNHWTAFQPLAAAAVIAAIWVSFDWLRGNTLIALPWLYLGHSQSPVLVVCQIADATGVYGLTFCIVMVNVLVAIALRDRFARWQQMLPAWIAAAMLIVAVVAYGAYRLSESQTYPGPRVMVVQPNDPMTRGGAKSVTQEQSLQFHLGTTLDALKTSHADLIAWSETTMPPLNVEAREALRASASGPFLERVHAALRGLTAGSGSALIAGGYYVGGWAESGGKRGTDIRNTAFYYDRTGLQQGRYDKIHLAPFGEVMPFRQSFPPLYRLFMWFGPNKEEYTLNPGDPASQGVFTLQTSDNATSRFVAPICFDDLDAPLMARMFRPADGPTDRAKRADFIVNLTNDGWFRWLEPQHHLQAAVFRSIENRVPTARAVNTGISGFIDSCGRIIDVIPAHTTGTLTRGVMLDRRMTLYTRFGDLFAFACMICGSAVVIATMFRRLKSRRFILRAQTA